MDTKFKKILGTGLAGGYGNSNYEKGIDRAGFKFDINDYQGPEGKYHDEWAAHQNGGGQEIVETPDGEKWTRVYGGGSPDDRVLQGFGTSGVEVGKKIMEFLGKVGKLSRFDEDYELTDGNWAYIYKIIRNVPEIPVFLGQEEIRFKGNLVFVHFIINSPFK